MSEQYMTEQLTEAMNKWNEINKWNENHMAFDDEMETIELEEEKAEHYEVDLERLQEQLYEATAMKNKIENGMLEDRVINLLRGHRLSLQSYTRIRNTLNRCLVTNDDSKSEYPSKELVDNFIRKFYNHFGMVEPEGSEIDFIKETEMEIF